MLRSGSTRPLRSLGFIPALTLACLWTTAPGVSAQETTQSLSQQKLQKLDQEIATREAQAKAYEADVAKTRQEYAALQKQLVSLASQIHGLERDVEATKRRLADLQDADREASIDLQAHAADMAETLAAMQRLSQHPTTTLMAKPEDINTMARTALLFDSILPSLNAQAETLRQKISAVETIRDDIRADQTKLRTRQAELETQRKDMTGLMAHKQQQRKQLSSALDVERKRIATLAKEAKSLGELIARLNAPTPAPRKEFADIGRPIDSPPFKSARGKLPLPAPGLIVSRFNQRKTDGSRSRGIHVETTQEAQVVSLWDGNIVFAGPFRDYGQLLIISHGAGYHSLLAGMALIDVDIAQWVLAGEPIGLMNAANNNADNTSPRLYIELRHDGRSIDPLPWIAVSHRKVKG